MAVDTRYADDPDTAADFRRLAGLSDGPVKEHLRGRIICAWLPMAHRLAARYRDRGETLEDLRQVAAVGLVNAVDRYDPAVTPAFAPFAIPTITGEIKRHFRDRMWTVHVPRRVQNLRNTVRLARAELAAAGLPTSLVHIAEHTGLSEDEVRQGNEALHGFSALSIDAEIAGHGDALLGDSLGAVDEAFDLVLDREAARPGILCLPEREKRVLYLRFFADLTQSAIAAELGVSQMHVSRLISESCRRIREHTAPEPAAVEKPSSTGRPRSV
ncbi:SigB/SigF/SigG family RNA polymerase sigma factor [Streptomyces sp. DH18]|uniref:SigB/SigF/SigG family RNA polymerase sigma factor n=1 Tax=unclassified Streptomyces TaxID=2593676 RepID=UPI001E4FC7AE|nr:MULTISPECIES: SigB/SigF/SigG family RNA polymerase sigma factor [unclassified Streptomyces]MDG9687590.1 SigB/SigF/SigG family RNA polymerase sigma factor [Streptomyces sp. DH18]